MGGAGGGLGGLLRGGLQVVAFQADGGEFLRQGLGVGFVADFELALSGLGLAAELLDAAILLAQLTLQEHQPLAGLLEFLRRLGLLHGEGQLRGDGRLAGILRHRGALRETALGHEPLGGGLRHGPIGRMIRRDDIPRHRQLRQRLGGGPGLAVGREVETRQNEALRRPLHQERGGDVRVAHRPRRVAQGPTPRVAVGH